MGPLFLLSTASLYFDSPAACFGLAAESGFDGVELSISPTNAAVPPERIHALAGRFGLQVASVHPPTVPLPGWGRSPAGLRRLAAVAHALPECRILVIHTPAARRPDDRRMLRFRRVLAAVQEVLSGTPLRVALENRNRRPGEPLALLDDPLALLDLARQEGCGVVLDTAHASTLPWPLLEIYRVLRERLVNIHLSDVVPMGWWDRFSYPRSILGHHRPPGHGTLPLRPMLAELGRSAYGDLITLELSPVALRFWNRPAARQLLREAVQTSRRWFGEGKGTA